MKKHFFLSILFIAIVSFVNATILTVSNTINLPSGPGQYTTPQAAHDAAYNGDTLLIQGTPNAYPDLNISKKLAIFGPGYNPQRENVNKAMIPTIYLQNGSAGTIIAGLYISNAISFNSISIASSNYSIYRNYVGSIQLYYPGGSGVISNVNIYNNVVSQISGWNDANSINWVIANNIITSNISSFNQSSITIKNNLFIQTTGGVFNNLVNCVISNNIFYGASPYNSSITLCAFNNNLTYNCTNPTLPYGSNVGSGNKISTDPMFLSVPTTTVTYTYNYRLNSASPAKNAGTDGTDIGLTGGTYPIYQSTTDILTGEPPIPKITLLNLTNSSVPAGGNLQFQVKAKKVN